MISGAPKLGSSEPTWRPLCRASMKCMHKRQSEQPAEERAGEQQGAILLLAEKYSANSHEPRHRRRVMNEDGSCGKRIF